MALPPLGTLRTIEAAARLGSFSRAADELCVTHSAVSHQIRHIEKWLGQRLFTRTSQGVTPTQACVEFSQLIGDCLGRLSDASLRLQRLSSTNTVRVAAIPSVASRWVIPRIPAFQRAFPDIDLMVSYAPQQFAGILSGFDVLITHFDGVYAGSLESTILFPGAVRPVCSPSYLNSNGPISTFEDLAGATFLHDEDRSSWVDWLSARDVEPTQAQTGTVFADFNLLSTAAIAGHGVALCPTDLMRHDLLAGHLVQLFDEAVFPNRNYVLFRRPSSSGATLSFCEWLVEETRL